MGVKACIEGDKYTAAVGKDLDKGTFILDASKKPKTIDVTGTEGPYKGKVILAIYELTEDTL